MSSQILKHTKIVLAYLFLYVYFVALICLFSKSVPSCNGMPEGLLVVIPVTLCFYILYVIINCFIIRRIVDLKIIVNLCIILFITLLVLFPVLLS